jgi:hypothetical protein
VPTYRVTVHAVRPELDVDGPRAGIGIRRVVKADDAEHAATQVLWESEVTAEMVGIWSARRRGVLGLGRRWSGRFGGNDDGLSGVREPRRPRPSAGSASAALDLPTA